MLGSFVREFPAAAPLPSRPEEAPILAASGVDQRFVVQGRATTVLDAFDFAVEEGSFVSIVGPSGCGKSTLLKLMAGLEPASGGEILFKGKRVEQPPKGVIYVFQQYTKSIFPWRTVLENVGFGLEHQRGLSRASRRERCQEYIRLVGLEGYESYYPSQLSGGMQQRVAIARALVCKPDVLMMDEPFSAVDALTRATLQQLMLNIWQSLPLPSSSSPTTSTRRSIFEPRRSLGRAPARIVDDVHVALPYPRDPVKTRSDARYIAARERLLSRILAAETRAPLTPSRNTRSNRA